MDDLGFLLNFLEEDQAKHLIYVLKKLGFSKNNTQSKFLERVFERVKAQYSSWIFRKYDRIFGLVDERPYGNYEFASIVYKEIKKEFAFRNTFFGDVSYQLPDGTMTVFRRISGLAKDIKIDKYITATDISSYVFCPVSYCIQASFNEAETTEEARVGAELHEEHRLVSLTTGDKRKHEFTASGKGRGFYTQYNFEFFDDIRSSKIYYVGHDQASKRYFKSSKGQLVGQPDYVFINERGAKYVVEEKFRPLAKQSNTIRQHHKAQLDSYILGLDELEANYGYIVYWYYVYENEQRTVKKCVVFKVEPTAEDRKLIKNAYKAISALNAGERSKFALNELNAAKCASCVVCKFCGHKTGRFDEIAVPYEKKFYELISAK